MHLYVCVHVCACTSMRTLGSMQDIHIVNVLFVIKVELLLCGALHPSHVLGEGGWYDQ